ncbi:MAG: DNA recombination protein RmuC [Clostridiales bacterium]|nr:DNA recombination protein RmuC [Clostridiales bacterium]
MQTTLLILTIVLAVVNLLLLVFLILRKKGGGNDGDIRRLEEKINSVHNLADYCARATENLNRTTEQRLANIQARLADDLKYIVDANAHNLERIRRTVDDKLTSSLDGKLSESYARIAERLEKMYESVGEMKSLSSSVSDIKRVFTNVKLRGTWGETQLNALLEQMLAPEQYRASVKLNPLDNTLVDFAVLLPAKNGDTVYLPIDSKFPVEEFDRLCDASERGDRAGVEQARKNLERAVKTQAESIAKKYILPPVTTDFAIMYLPLEGLYAEILKMPALAEYLHAKRVMVCGPTNFGALLSTLQTGFRTAAIEKRSGELRQMLEAFRLDFAKFSDLLDKTSKKLREAQDSIESAAKRTNVIGRKLDSFRAIGELPPPDEE